MSDVACSTFFLRVGILSGCSSSPCKGLGRCVLCTRLLYPSWKLDWCWARVSAGAWAEVVPGRFFWWEANGFELWDQHFRWWFLSSMGLVPTDQGDVTHGFPWQAPAEAALLHRWISRGDGCWVGFRAALPELQAVSGEIPRSNSLQFRLETAPVARCCNHRKI